jgi:hypothetical protein
VERLAQFCADEDDTIAVVSAYRYKHHAAADEMILEAMQRAARLPVNESLRCGATARAYVAATAVDALRSVCQEDSPARALIRAGKALRPESLQQLDNPAQIGRRGDPNGRANR